MTERSPHKETSHPRKLENHNPAEHAVRKKEHEERMKRALGLIESSNRPIDRSKSGPAEDSK